MIVLDNKRIYKQNYLNFPSECYIFSFDHWKIKILDKKLNLNIKYIQKPVNINTHPHFPKQISSI